MSISSSPEASLKRRDYFVLFAVALAVGVVLMALQPVPGYMDAVYYYAGSLQLVHGHGFNDAFIWNFLDQPAGLPHPSNSYWYPLASLVAAGGMLLTGHANFLSARLGFLAMSSLAPLAVAALAWRIARRRQPALLAGFLAIFSGYYLPFVVTTDNYGLYLLAGALFFLLLDGLTFPRALLLGLLAGLLNLARGDGILWLPLTLTAVALQVFREAEPGPFRTRGRRAVSMGLAALLGYLAVMGPWFARNQVVFGSLLPPGSSHVLWMTGYNQIYSFTPQIYTFQSWLANGWQAIVAARLHALWQNLTTGFFAEGSIVLVPLIVVGAWKTWCSVRVKVAIFGWVAMLLAESLLFPFASVNGGFSHAGTAFQPLWFVLAALGVDAVINHLLRDRRNLVQKAAFSRVLLVLVMLLFSALLVKIRVIDQGWTEGEYTYQKADRFLAAEGAGPQDVVLVRNPPAYFVMTGRPTVVIPYGGVSTLLAAAHKYGARYVILEGGVVIQPLEDLYAHPGAYPQFTSLESLMTTSSSPSTPLLSGAPRRVTWLILAAAAALSLGAYLLASGLTYRVGFPLDDSWIHQTYARNLADTGQWAFVPGVPSGGSTAPLWSALLAVGFLIHLGPYVWTFFLGGLLLFGLAFQSELAVRSLVEGYRGGIPWAGLFVVFEWHMAWASASGMETLLQACLVLAVLVLLIRKSRRWTFLGILAGISVWVRPDGLTLLGPILFTAVLAGGSGRERIKAVTTALLGFGALLVPYLLFNLVLNGTVMPNTFYAKQAEYAAWQAEPLLLRIWVDAMQFLTGPALLLLPGVVYTFVSVVRRREWGSLSGYLWMLGYIGIYVLRLPAYQHGRYLMPAMPVYFLFGLLGFYAFVLRRGRASRKLWLVRTAWGGTLLLVSLGFWFLGMRAYAQDVRFIESEMVASARWVAANLPQDSLVAAHDIGALGYFGNHNLVDLAGLVSPEVIPILRDESKLAGYLDARRVAYLVVFPDWYPTLTSNLEIVYTTGAPYAPALGGTNMTIYRWSLP